MSLTEQNERGRLTISREAIDRLTDIIDEKKKLEEEEKQLRHTILQAMIANNIDKCENSRVTISLTNVKPIEEFDVESFLMNEDTHMTSIFTTLDKTETFDIEKFKKEQPELYNTYLIIEENPVVDTKKLKEMLPKVYKKYTTLRDSDKKESLRVYAKK